MSYVPTPDRPMSDAEAEAAEQMMARYEITQSDLRWLLGLEDDENDRPVPRGFKSLAHFEAMLWHKQQKALGRKVPRKRKRRAA